MTHLGAFGEARPPEDISFDYFGRTFHANPNLSELDYVDFLERAGSINLEDLSSLGMVKSLARLYIAEDEFDDFWSTARANRQGVEDVFTVVNAIIEASVDRPTGQPSDSVDGLGTTGTKSEDADYSRAMKVLDGRPDLQLAVVQRRQHLAAVS